MSCKIISIDELARIIPVKPPKVNRNTKPKTHNIDALKLILDPWRVANHLKILIPVGTAIIIVAAVK
ncbi:MAG: hypothetical protein MRQ09_06815 [Candidatus Midichloria sp.]|nr:hypothetical protein [Candidatus Midichloria sp.]